MESSEGTEKDAAGSAQIRRRLSPRLAELRCRSAHRAERRQCRLFLETSLQSAVRLTVEMLSEGLGFARDFELDRNEHAAIRVTARKGRGLKAMFVQPDPHRRHLPAEISLFHVNVHTVHAQPLGCFSERLP